MSRKSCSGNHAEANFVEEAAKNEFWTECTNGGITEMVHKIRKSLRGHVDLLETVNTGSDDE